MFKSNIPIIFEDAEYEFSKMMEDYYIEIYTDSFPKKITFFNKKNEAMIFFDSRRWPNCAIDYTIKLRDCFRDKYYIGDRNLKIIMKKYIDKILTV